ncbi:MAG TPA: DUF4157 domain-containing protein [Longimicrobiales bacterium]|nr:DUF4157 domain-containing protein [Longimicrobiales bacterium]
MLTRLVRPLLGSVLHPPPPGPPLPAGVELRVGRWVPALAGRLSGMRRSAAAVTLGRTIVLHPDVRLDDRLLRHELEHVRQWRRHPLTFPMRYTLCHIRYGYHDNPYERAARDAERG